MSEDTWQYICQHPKETKRLLGISFEQLEQLIELAKILHQKEQEESAIKIPRLISKGGGRAARLSGEEQVILTLMYLRHNLTFQVLGIMFKISESSAHKLFNYWQKLLREGVTASLLEQVKKSGNNLGEFLENLTEYELIVDSVGVAALQAEKRRVEQARERPLDYQTQKKS